MSRADIERCVRIADRFALALGLVWLNCVVLYVHFLQFPHFDRWFGWADQGHYLVSARAFAHGQLDPALHHYPPGYSLMAAPFVWLFPSEPFAVPDLLCLSAALIIFGCLVRRLAPDAPGWRSAGIFAFCLAASGSPAMRHIWSVPWNTTGAAPFELGALLAAFRLVEAPCFKRAAILGLVLGVLAGIRPSDAAVLAPCCGIFSLILCRRLPARSLLTVIAAGVTGLLAGCAPFAIAHMVIHGADGGFYLAKSTDIGFEWRLLKLRWVTLVLDPRPLLPEGTGLAEALPWIVPGFAGVLLLISGRGRDAAAWRFVSAAIALHWVLYLSYRDLQPYGLWRFNNVHYFKWTFPFLVLAGLRLVVSLVSATDRTRAISASICSLVFLLWQPVGVETGRYHSTAAGKDGVLLPVDLSSVDKSAFLPLLGSWRQIYFGPPTLAAHGLTFDHTRDFKLQPVAGGAVLQPLRPFPSGPMMFKAGPDTQLIAGDDIVGITDAIVFGLPCGILHHRASCKPVVYDPDVPAAAP